MVNTPREATLPVPIGALLGGKYRIKRFLGGGGMGAVFVAHHEVLDQLVAIKVLRPGIVDETSRARFLREARAASKLQSEHVARVFDVGEFEGLPFLAMEYMEGVDLRELLRSRRKLRVVDAVDYVLMAIDALAEAHSLGIVHRDLNPSNLFLAVRSDGKSTIKVVDFGISKVDSEASRELTTASEVLGTPSYMSPEQLRSAKTVGPAADQWSLGVVLYALLAGQLPFRGESFGELAHAIFEASPKSLRDHRAEIPDELDRIVRRCLSKEPADRYPTLAGLARALKPFGSGQAARVIERAGSLLDLDDVSESPDDAPGVAPVDATVIMPPPRLEDVQPPQATPHAWGGPQPPLERRTARGLPVAIVAIVGALAIAAAIAVAGFSIARSRAAASKATPSSTAPAPGAPSGTGAPESTAVVPTATVETSTATREPITAPPSAERRAASIPTRRAPMPPAVVNSTPPAVVPTPAPLDLEQRH